MAELDKTISVIERWLKQPVLTPPPINELYDALELLKEQEAEIEKLNRFVNGFSRDAMPVVRCKDCKYWSAERINDYNKCKRWINIGVKNFATMGDWFCADGERK